MDSLRHLRLSIVVLVVVATACVALVSCGQEATAPVQHETAIGQAAAAELLTAPQVLVSGQEAWATLTLSTSDGLSVFAYAVADTEFYERGPNDEGYSLVDAKSEGFVAYSNWAGGGSCPAELEYDVYDSHGSQVNVLTKVRYFLNGE